MLYLKVIPNVGYRQLGIQDHTRAAREARNMMTVIIRLNTIQGVDGKNRCEGKKDGQRRAKEGWQPTQSSRNFLFLSMVKIW